MTNSPPNVQLSFVIFLHLYTLTLDEMGQKHYVVRITDPLISNFASIKCSFCESFLTQFMNTLSNIRNHIYTHVEIIY